MKLMTILKEIGETTKPYPFTLIDMRKRGGDAGLDYEFVNKNYDTIRVYISVDMKSPYYNGPEFTVTYYDLGSEHSEDEDAKYEVLTNSGDSLRVISTVISCIRDAAVKLLGSIDEVHCITFKGDNKRFNIYLKYSQKQLPKGWEIRTRNDETIELINTNKL